jgi:Tfp pilus assembly protein PilX
MIPKKNKGSALIAVIMIMVVMTILGMAILNISLSETKQASNEDKKMQAHYLARSGAEATLSAWENPVNVIKPSGVCNPVFLNNSNEFVNVQPADMIGKFEVEIKKLGGVTTIISDGTVGNVKQTVTVTIKEVTTTVPIPPLDKVAGESIGWYSFNSGQINTGVNTPGPSGKVVNLKAKNGKGLKIPNKNSPAATFEANQMQFISPTQILHNSIILSSKLIAFNVPVDFSNNGNGKGALVLKVLGDGYTPNGSHFSNPVGVVFFENVGYYFKNISDGIILRRSSDIQSQVTANNLEKITDPNFKNPFLSTPTETITSYTIIWS